MITVYTLPLYAQRPFWMQVWKLYGQNGVQQATSAEISSALAKQTFNESLTSGQMGYFLENCLDCSFQQATSLHLTLDATQRPIYGMPMQGMYHTKEMVANEIYPDLSFLKNEKNTSRYFSIRNNREYVSEVKRMQKYLPQLKKRLPDMQRLAREMEQPTNIIPWLADKIPFETKNLFLGEAHLKNDEIRSVIADLLPAIRAKYPQREIFLFTEFLPEKYKWQGIPVYQHMPEWEGLRKFFPIWEQARQNQIQVIGLEKPYIIDDHCLAKYMRSNGKNGYGGIWSSLEGVRVRNESWTQLMKQQRMSHPDALFIIYTGAAHSLYTYPFTLTPNGPDSTTFVASFYPTVRDVFDSRNVQITSERTDPLEQLIDEVDFPQPVLYWDDPELARLAGFNVRIKVFVFPSD